MTVRMKVDMRTVQLLQLTDTHLFGDPAGEVYDVNTANSLAAVLDDALGGGRPRPDAILVTGDIAEDESAAAYVALRRALAPAGVPVYCLPGNHDAPVLMAANLHSGGFQCCGHARLGDWLLVMLNSHVSGDAGGHLSHAELARLESLLAAHRGIHALVGVHHPPVSVGSQWLDGFGLRNADELFGVIERHAQVRGIVSGHVHQSLDVRRGEIRVLTTPATCAQFLPQTRRCVMDQRPPGYRWLRLHADGAIESEVVWLGHWSHAKPVRDTHDERQ